MWLIVWILIIAAIGVFLRTRKRKRRDGPGTVRNVKVEIKSDD